MELPKRKPQRLKDYDYSQNNAYFITICAQNMLPLSGRIINGTVVLSDAGKMVHNKLKEPTIYNITVNKHIVMPNHIHAILRIDRDGTAPGPFPTLSELIRRFKTLTTKLCIDGVKDGRYPQFEKKIWQKSFYDHIIRDEKGYQAIWRYIDDNPLKWQDDDYYILGSN